MVQDVQLDLPEYEAPPVIEAICGMQFAPVHALDAATLFDLQEVWRATYPDRTVKLDAAWSQQPSLTLQLEDVRDIPPIRMWAANEESGMLLQTSRERLVLNWRKLDSDRRYPRFPTMAQEFDIRWRELERFVADLDAASLVPLEAEYTYLNRVPLDDGVSLESVLAVLAEAKSSMPGVPRSTRFQIVRDLLDDTDSKREGVLVVTGEPGHADGTDYLMLNVVANVLCTGHPAEPMHSVSRAHEAATKAFSSITEGSMQEFWGRQR